MNEIIFNNFKKKHLDFCVNINSRDGKPYIVLRKEIYDINIIHEILMATLNNSSIVIHPQFKDKLRSLYSLQQKKLIEYDRDSGEYYFINSEKNKKN